MRCSRLAALIAGLLSFGTLSACDDAGFGAVDADWDRREAGAFYVVNARHDRAVVSALGRQVAIEPADGFCLAKDSVEASSRSAFALIGDCALEQSTSGVSRSARGELQLPRGLPGIITVSISGDPGFTGSDDADQLDGLSKFLDSAKGRAMLGRSGSSADVEVVERRRIGTGVYVHVDDNAEGVVPVLDPKFWRAFVELNDRLAVVTVSGFRDRPLGKEEMLAHLVDQVKTLRSANRNRIDEPGILLAASRPEPAQSSDDQVVALTDLKPEPLQVTVQKPAAAEVSAPSPKPRPEAEPAIAEVTPEKPEAVAAVAQSAQPTAPEATAPAEPTVLAAATPEPATPEPAAPEPAAPEPAAPEPAVSKPATEAPERAEPQAVAAAAQKPLIRGVPTVSAVIPKPAQRRSDAAAPRPAVPGTEHSAPKKTVAVRVAEPARKVAVPSVAPTSAPKAPRRPGRA